MGKPSKSFCRLVSFSLWIQWNKGCTSWTSWQFISWEILRERERESLFYNTVADSHLSSLLLSSSPSIWALQSMHHMADIYVYTQEMKWLLAVVVVVVVRGDLIFTLIWHICWMVANLLQLFTCLPYKIMFLHKNTCFCQQSFGSQMPRQHTHSLSLLLWSNVTFFEQWVPNVVGTALGQGLYRNNDDGPHKVESSAAHIW
jgi:hypothetical protein